MSSKTKRIIFCFLIFAAGCIAGVGTKYFDTISADGTMLHDTLQFVGQLLSEIPFWVFIGSILAYYSSTSKAAAIHTALFFAGLLISYYLYTGFLFGFLPVYQILRWSIFCLCFALAGYVIWYAGKKGWPAALCAALPIGYLLTEGYVVYYTHDIKDMAALVMAAALYVLLPKSNAQKLRVLPLAALVIFVIVRFDLVARIFGGL